MRVGGKKTTLTSVANRDRLIVVTREDARGEARRRCLAEPHAMKKGPCEGQRIGFRSQCRFQSLCNSSVPQLRYKISQFLGFVTIRMFNPSVRNLASAERAAAF